MPVKKKLKKCDVCESIIRSDFKRILIYNVHPKFIIGTAEKKLDVCKSCAEHLNFRKYKKEDKCSIHKN